MSRQIQLLDVVALLQDRDDLGLVRGQVGTIVEVYEPDVFEVEFNTVNGVPYASKVLSANELMLLHHQQVSSSQFNYANKEQHLRAPIRTSAKVEENSEPNYSIENFNP